MQNEESLPRPEEEKLAAQMPDPSGPPQPVEQGDPVLSLITAVGVGLVALGGLMLPAFVSTGHTAGATRSAKLHWESRGRQIEQAFQEEQACAAKAEQPASEGRADGSLGR
jgi:hypothetical protein